MVDSTNLEGLLPKTELGFALSGEEMEKLEKFDQKKRLQVRKKREREKMFLVLQNFFDHGK